MEELFKEKGSALECRDQWCAFFKPPVQETNLVGLCCLWSSVFTSPSISLESGLSNLKFPCCTCGTGIQTILCAGQHFNFSSSI